MDSILKSKRRKRMRTKDLVVLEMLGSGNFGTVSKGIYQHRLLHLKTYKEIVAVKILKNEHGEKSFMEEGLISEQISHKNIVKVIAMCLEADYKMLILELCDNGSLRNHLIYERKKGHPLSSKRKMAAIIDVCNAMVYLEKEFYIHRDLRAHNCMMKGYTVKLGDFGLAKTLRGRTDKVYYDTNAEFPTRYTAIEGFHGVFSIKSDVWSFAILIWQVFADGAEPYERIFKHYCFQEGIQEDSKLTCTQRQHWANFLHNYLRQGGNLINEDCASLIPIQILDIAKQSLNPDKNERPSFRSLLLELVSAQKKIKPSIIQPNRSAGTCFEDDYVRVPNTVYSDWDINGYTRNICTSGFEAAANTNTNTRMRHPVETLL